MNSVIFLTAFWSCLAVWAADEQTVVDFEQEKTASMISVQANSTLRYELQNSGNGKILSMTVSPGVANYPGIIIKPQQAWDLSRFGYLSMKVTNTGKAPVSVALRADSGSQWSGNQAYLAPGKTVILQTHFGYKFGKLSNKCDQSKINQILVFIGKPKEELSFQIENIIAGGTPEDKPADNTVKPELPVNGVMVSAESTAALKVNGADGSALSFGDNAYTVTLPANPEYMKNGLTILPVKKNWDIRKYGAISFEISNIGSSEGTVICSAGTVNSSDRYLSIKETIKAGERKSILLPFTLAPGWNANLKTASHFDSTMMPQIGIYAAPENKEPLKIALHKVTAVAAPPAVLPDWLGKRPPVPGNWHQTLNENFDGDSLNKSLWTPRLHWDGPPNNEIQRYLEENITVKDGCMVIKSERNPGHQYNNPKLPTRDYATGAVTSIEKWSQRYGYFEARMKQPKALGLWPAFWTMPIREASFGNIWQRNTTKLGGMEFDIFEHLTRFGPYRYNIACHWDGYEKEHKFIGDDKIYFAPDKEGFVTAGMLWGPGKLEWFCNGNKVGEWQNERIANVPAYILFTIQMGSWSGYEVDDKALPDYFLIDYVRVWQLQEWEALPYNPEPLSNLRKSQ